MSPFRKGLNDAFLIGVVLAALIAVLCWSGPAEAQDQGPADAKDQPGEQPDRSTAHLYFADKKKPVLIAEERVLARSETPEDYASHIIRALINGPRKGLMRTLPAETGLRALYILKDGTAYVDLSEEVSTHHPGGVQMERLSIYSVVNSLILNVSEIHAVKILIGGRESLTLAGHLDLRFPFKAEMLLIR